MILLLLAVVEAVEGDHERAEQALELEPDHYLGHVFPATLYARATERFERPEARQVAERREFLLPAGVQLY